MTEAQKTCFNLNTSHLSDARREELFKIANGETKINRWLIGVHTRWASEVLESCGLMSADIEMLLADISDSCKESI